MSKVNAFSIFERMMSDKEHEAYLTGIAENQSVVGHLRAQLEEAQQHLVESQEAKRLLNEQYTLLEAENKQIKSQLDAEQQRAVKAEAACAEIPEALAEYVKAAVAAEREACAKLAEEGEDTDPLSVIDVFSRAIAGAIRARGPSNALDEALRKARLSEAEWWFSAEVIQDEETGKYTTTIQEMEQRLAALREPGKVGK